MVTKMKKNVAVSVIVPVYNVEQYLRRCLDTIIAQTLNDLEIILVDDGSTDRSGEICDEYAELHGDKISVIHQSNQGLGPARNAGMSIAAGEYIGFVDSDDWIAVDMYEKLYGYAVQGKFDMVFSDIFYIDAVRSTITKKSLYYKQEPCRVTSEQALINGVYCYTVNKLFRRDIIIGEKFPKLVFEDIPVITKAISKCSRIGYLPEAFYYYERKPGTLSTTYKSAAILDTIEVERLALDQIDSKCREALLFAFAKRFLQNIYSERKVMAADLVEHLNIYGEEYRNNQYLRKHGVWEKISKYIGMETIPKTIFYANFGNKKYEDYEKACIRSWKNMTRGFKFIELTEANSDMANIPACVKKALEKKDFKFVGDFFLLKNICTNGGIAINPCIYFLKPIGELRMEKTFIGFKNKSELLSDIYGSVKDSNILNKVLNTYNDDTMSDLSFVERLSKILVADYSLNMGGWTQKLGDGIRVFKCDTLAYDMQTTNSITKLLTKDSYHLLESPYEIVEKSVLKYWSDDRNSIWKQKENLRKKLSLGEKNEFVNENADLQQQLNMAYKKIGMYENSKSWKMTQPLRNMYYFWKKINKNM